MWPENPPDVLIRKSSISAYLPPNSCRISIVNEVKPQIATTFFQFPLHERKISGNKKPRGKNKAKFSKMGTIELPINGTRL